MPTQHRLAFDKSEKSEDLFLSFPNIFVLLGHQLQQEFVMKTFRENEIVFYKLQGEVAVGV